MEEYRKPNNNKYFEDPRLDLEFRQILCIIRQFILQVTSTQYLTLCRCWLEKLNLENYNKPNRNRYLIELAKQIKDKVLYPPFDRAPYPGPLKPFPEEEVANIQNIREVHSEEFNFNHTNCEICPEIRDTTEKRPQTVQCHISDSPPACIPRGKAVDSYRITDSNNYIYYPNREDTFVRGNNINSIKKRYSEESSWCDLTDTSNTSITTGAGDAKAKRLSHKPIMDDSNGDELKKPDVEDSQDKKLSLKDTKFIPADWKMTIESLQLRLTETLSQNSELKNVIENLNVKLAQEVEARQQLEAKLKISEKYDKEIEIARNTTTDNQLQSLQRVYESEMEQHYETSELKIDEVKTSYELKLNKIKQENEIFKEEKENEINRFSNIIQEQSERMTGEISNLRKEIQNCITTRGDDKIIVLQKCISKMDRLFHKSEKEYLKQIEKLKQDLELKKKVQQIQMITQRAEITARTSAENQKQVDEVMNNLEVKYIKMLEFYEMQFIDNKRQDKERIEYLAGLLKKHNIPFNIF